MLSVSLRKGNSPTVSPSSKDTVPGREGLQNSNFQKCEETNQKKNLFAKPTSLWWYVM